MILGQGNDSLKGYIEANISTYVEDVFLELPENTEESESAITALLNQADLTNSVKEQILTKENHIFDSFENIPAVFWAQLLQDGKVSFSWANVSNFLAVQEEPDAILTKVLEGEQGFAKLSAQDIVVADIGDKKAKALSKFILNNDALSDDKYCTLIQCIPYKYTNFPDTVSAEKLECLAVANKISLTEVSFEFCSNKDELKAILISANFDEYLVEKEKYEIDDDVRGFLISGSISDAEKLKISLDFTPSYVDENEDLATLISDLLISTGAEVTKFDDLVLTSAIVNARTHTDSIKLLMKCIPNWDEATTMSVLAELPKPYCDIAKYGKHPKLDKTSLHQEFVQLLEQQNYISSFSCPSWGSSIRVNTFKSQDH